MNSYGQVRVRLPLASVLLRFLLVAFLVFATYNPSAYTITAWLVTGEADLGVRLFAAFSLFAVWLTVLRLSFAGLGYFGLFLLVCAAVSFIILEFEYELLARLSSYSLTIFFQLAVSAIIALGLILSYVIRQLSGQSPVIKNPP